MKLVYSSDLRFPGRALGVVLAAMMAIAAMAQDSDQLHAEAQKLEKHVADLKAKGHGDEADKVIRQAKELRARAKGNTKEATKDPVTADQGRGNEKMMQLRREWKELHAAGKKEEAEELRRRIEKTEGKSAPKKRDAEKKQSVSKSKRAEHPESGGLGEPERRLYHLQAAVDNLRAAGMHEPAENLARHAQRLRQQIAAGEGMPLHRNVDRSLGPRGPEQGGELRDLRAQLGELHNAVRELRAQLEHLNRERR